MDKQLTERQKALIDWIHAYMLSSAGRPPTLREMLSDKVCSSTNMGQITSKSVLRYNLQRLEEHGEIELIPDGTSRNIKLPGGQYFIMEGSEDAAS